MRLNLFSISGLLLTLICFIVIFVVLKYGKSKIHRIWALFNFVLSVWGISSFFVGKATTPSEAVFWLRIGHIGVIFIPIVFLHHVCLFCEIQRKNLLKFAYLQGLIFLLLDTTGFFLPDNARIVFNSFYYTRSEGFLYPVFFIIWVGLISYSYFEVLRFYRHSHGLKRTQVRYFLFGTIVGFLGGITNFSPHFGINLYPYGNLTIPLYCIIFTYAIFRYRLMDINFVFKRTMAYSLAAGILTSLFVVLVISMTKFLSDWAGITSLTITVIAALIIATLFNPLKNRIQKIIDKIFYKKTYDYYATLRKVSHELASIFDLKKIYNFTGDIIFSTLGLKNIYLLAVEPSGDYEVVHHMSYGVGKGERKKEEKKWDKGNGADGELFKIDRSSDIVKLLTTSDDIVIKDELPAIIGHMGQEAIDNIIDTLKPFNGEAVVPIFIDGKLSFLIILGEKLSGDMFTDEDIKLLGTISNQTAIAIKNANLYTEKVKSERLASMGMMSATFAHEIRNPLTSIKTFAQLMPEKHNDPEFQDTFSKIVIDEIERIDALIKDLLHFSSEKTLPSMDNVDITALIDEIIEYLKIKLELEKRKITVEKIYKSVKINIMGDSKKLKQAFINIINNGCQAMGENGVLKVDINPNTRDVDISITDTGDGISRQEIAKIFEPFYTTKTFGVGLGLAISRKIIEDYGGRIKVESELSKGTTFTVSLPINNN